MDWSDAHRGWLVTSRAAALAVLRDPEGFTVDDPRFATARVVGPSMLSLDGPEHARHRAAFAAAYRPASVRALSDVIEGEARALADAAPHELGAEYAAPLAARVMAHVLGIGETPTADILRWYRAIVRATTEASEGREPDPSGAAAFAELAAAITPALARRAAAGDAAPRGAAPRGDAAAHRAARTAGLTADEAASNAGVLLFGGIETVEGMILNAVWHLLTHPDALAAVRADPALVNAAVEESLRLEPAAAVVDRYATRDAPPAKGGDKVVVSLRDANRDPAHFDHPDTFDLHRPEPRGHITFAAGPHVCLGVHLARLEARIAVRALLDRFPDLRLAEPTRPEGLIFRKPPQLRVTW